MLDQYCSNPNLYALLLNCSLGRVSRISPRIQIRGCVGLGIGCYRLASVSDMFSGIVEEKGRVLSCLEEAGSWRYVIEAKTVLESVSIGDSVAVNGCCLTVVEIGVDSLRFDVLEETRRLTNLRDIDKGAAVNLERSLRYDGRLGGHFVTGHVDGLGKICTLRPEGKDVLLEIELPDCFERYVVYKGCIAIDGMSLTVAEIVGNIVTIWLIPHTLEVTIIGERGVGDFVNLEFDLIAKYTEKLLGKAGDEG